MGVCLRGRSLDLVNYLRRVRTYQDILLSSAITYHSRSNKSGPTSACNTRTSSHNGRPENGFVSASNAHLSVDKSCHCVALITAQGFHISCGTRRLGGVALRCLFIWTVLSALCSNTAVMVDNEGGFDGTAAIA